MAVGWNDPSEVFVAGDGEVYVASVGTALPSTPTGAPNTSFHGLGYHDEDGATLSFSPEITDFGAWQTPDPIRREVNSRELQVTFNLQQWNEDTVPFAFGGGAITDLGGGGYRYDFPTSRDALQERSLILDCADGTTHKRIVIPRGNVTDAVETQFQRTETAKLAVTFKALAPLDGSAIAYMLTDSPAYATGS